MHIFVYEWATGGGLVDDLGPLPASLVREGSAMLGALVTDLTRMDGARVTVLRDPRVLHLALPGSSIVEVTSRFSHGEELSRLAGEADATILIAPEFDSILLKAVREAELSGGKLLSPSLAFIRVAMDKHATCTRLSAAGVPVPQGVVLEPEDPLPADFPYPAVIKPVDGAGSQDSYLVTGPHDFPPAYAWRRRLERYVPGLATSVAMLCGPAGHLTLAPCKQRISDDGRLRYLGGELPLTAGLAERATALAEQAIAAMPPAIGYVGIDLVLGREPDGSEDVVIEINPRLTTSYVGLRAAASTNVASAMCRIAQGERVERLEFSTRPIEFDPSGNVSYLR